MRRRSGACRRMGQRLQARSLVMRPCSGRGLRKAGIARIGKSRPRNVGSKAVSAAVLANPWEGG
ncbi:hypothetical protein [uncultured Bilophila sp.]|uniref:hypothetical protein n=1 Tax=uncultured Bilophila sp. TaxID=529385 RepID=UPI0026DD2E44|nr:hypothetical protein [uncultured Bilophila sp.]